MPFVKIHLGEGACPDRAGMVREAREAVVSVLQVKETIGQVMLYETPLESRSAHFSRDQRFAFVEVTMYPGRAASMKRNLLQAISVIISRHTGIEGQDINCCIYEVAAENWYGGVSHPFIEEGGCGRNS